MLKIPMMTYFLSQWLHCNALKMPWLKGLKKNLDKIFHRIKIPILSINPSLVTVELVTDVTHQLVLIWMP